MNDRRQDRLREAEEGIGHDPSTFNMTSLFPENTGLPMTIRVGPRGRALRTTDQGQYDAGGAGDDWRWGRLRVLRSLRGRRRGTRR